MVRCLYVTMVDQEPSISGIVFRREKNNAEPTHTAHTGHTRCRVPDDGIQTHVSQYHSAVLFTVPIARFTTTVRIS